MYTEALKQIRESREMGKVGTPGQPPRKGRKLTRAERRAFSERQGWAAATAPESVGVATAENQKSKETDHNGIDDS